MNHVWTLCQVLWHPLQRRPGLSHKMCSGYSPAWKPWARHPQLSKPVSTSVCYNTWAGVTVDLGEREFRLFLPMCRRQQGPDHTWDSAYIYHVLPHEQCRHLEEGEQYGTTAMLITNRLYQLVAASSPGSGGHNLKEWVSRPSLGWR